MRSCTSATTPPSAATPAACPLSSLTPPFHMGSARCRAARPRLTWRPTSARACSGGLIWSANPGPAEPSRARGGLAAEPQEVARSLRRASSGYSLPPSGTVVGTGCCRGCLSPPALCSARGRSRRCASRSPSRVAPPACRSVHRHPAAAKAATAKAAAAASAAARGRRRRSCWPATRSPRSARASTAACRAARARPPRYSPRWPAENCVF